MVRILAHIPLAGIVAFMALIKIFRYKTSVLRISALAVTPAVLIAVYLLGRRNQASPIHKAMLGYLALAGLTVWMWPGTAGRLILAYPASALYSVLFLVAAGPLIMGREVFTMYFARQTTPADVWHTDIFKTINRHLTALWAGLFLCGMASGAVPGLFNFKGLFYETVFEGLVPAVFMIGIGIPANKHYPVYYQRKLGLIAPGKEP